MIYLFFCQTQNRLVVKDYEPGVTATLELIHTERHQNEAQHDQQAAAAAECAERGQQHEPAVLGESPDQRCRVHRDRTSYATRLHDRAERVRSHQVKTTSSPEK